MTEIYQGVKFEVVHVPDERIADSRVDELILAGKTLSAKGFCPANSGNMSFRRADGFVITRAGSELGKLEPHDFVLVKDVHVGQKKVFAVGASNPSSEAIMHFLIYGARPEISVILHAHALDLKNAVITTEAPPYGTLEFARSAVDILKNHDLVILKGHGFVSVGGTVEESLLKIR